MIYSAEIHGLELMYSWDQHELFHNGVEKRFFSLSPQAVMKADGPTQLSVVYPLLCDPKWSSHVPALR